MLYGVKNDDAPRLCLSHLLDDCSAKWWSAMLTRRTRRMHIARTEHADKVSRISRNVHRNATVARRKDLQQGLNERRLEGEEVRE